MKLFGTFLSLYGLLIFGLCVLLANATETRADDIPPGDFMAGSIETKKERITPGDRIDLTIMVGGETRHESELTVLPDGTIKVPLLGEIKVAGLTSRELEEAVRLPLAKDYYVDPKVYVNHKVNFTAEEMRKEEYYVWGAVQRPGLIKMPANTRLLKLIMVAGGVTADAGRSVYIIKNVPDTGAEVTSEKDLPPESLRIEVPLEQLLKLGDTGLNPIVMNPGDIVYIPFKETLSKKVHKIYIEGEIANPGVYDFQEGITALKACIVAGGFKEHSAPNRTKIFRGSGETVKTIKVNLIRVQKGKEKDILLKSDDRIYIPQSWF